MLLPAGREAMRWVGAGEGVQPDGGASGSHVLYVSLTLCVGITLCVCVGLVCVCVGLVSVCV